MFEGRTGKPHWRRDEAPEEALALIREQEEPVRRERSSGADEISLIGEWKVLSQSVRHTDGQNKMSSLVTPVTLDSYDP